MLLFLPLLIYDISRPGEAFLLRFLCVFAILSQRNGERFINIRAGIGFRKEFKVKNLVLRKRRIEDEKRRTNRKKRKVGL